MTALRRVDGAVFDAVLCDMDGTLVSSEAAALRSWQRWAKEYGLPADFDGGSGKATRGVVKDVLPADKVDDGYARIQAIQVEEVDGIKMLPGAAERFTRSGTTGKRSSPQVPMP